MNSDDLSGIFEKLNIDKNSISQDSINNFLSMLGNSNNNNESSFTYDNPSHEGNIDMETLLKMKSVMEKMNSKDDPRSNLLTSLKPYLKEGRKGKLDQYIQLMNMSKIIDVMGGGNKKNEQ